MGFADNMVENDACWDTEDTYITGSGLHNGGKLSPEELVVALADHEQFRGSDSYGYGSEYDYESAHDDEFGYIDEIIGAAKICQAEGDSPEATFIREIAEVDRDEIDPFKENFIGDTCDKAMKMLAENK
jgi:hypothetical protein